MIDSHAHVDMHRFDQDRDAVLARARSAGVRLIVNVGCDLPGSERSVELAAQEADVYATVGIHPHEAGQDWEAQWDGIVALAARPKVVAIGECGLDRGPWNEVPMELQERLLRRHVALSRDTGLPLVIHNRETYPELFRILEDESAHGPLRGVMHCFSGGPDDAKKSVELGFHVSFSGVLTFKNAQNLRDAAHVVPHDRLMVETDCPYLTPEPHRGKRNEPAFVVHTAERLARELSMPLTEIESLTEQNTLAAFGLDPKVLA